MDSSAPAERIIDGSRLAADLRARIRAAVGALPGFQPGLAVVLVGEDAASQVYVRNKAKRTVECGMNSIAHRLDAATGEADLLALIGDLNADDGVDGILVQLPLPDRLDARAVLDAIDPEKDVDGFHTVNAGRLATGGAGGLVPCTPLGCLLLLRDRLGDLAGRHAVVLGRSSIVGRPMAQLLLAADCTVTMAHSRTADLPCVIRRGDIVIAAIGRPAMIRGDWLKPGATVIDVGINRVPAPDKGAGKTRLVGDVAFEAALAVAGAITPVPGGVGPMTIACLLRNTLEAACRRRGLAVPAL